MKLGRLFSILIALLWITFSTHSMTVDPAGSMEKESLEQHEDGDQDNQQEIYKLTEAVQSISQINLNFQSFLMTEIELIGETLTPSVKSSQFVISQSKEFSVLHERIISPNAP